MTPPPPKKRAVEFFFQNVQWMIITYGLNINLFKRFWMCPGLFVLVASLPASRANGLAETTVSSHVWTELVLFLLPWTLVILRHLTLMPLSLQNLFGVLEKRWFTQFSKASRSRDITQTAQVNVEQPLWKLQFPWGVEGKSVFQHPHSWMYHFVHSRSSVYVCGVSERYSAQHPPSRTSWGSAF